MIVTIGRFFIPSPEGKVPQCVHWGGRGIRVIRTDACRSTDIFRYQFCRHSSPVFCFAKSTLPPGEGMDSDLLAVTILDVLERERINPFPIIYNVTNRAGLGSDDMQCTMHALSAGTRRFAALEIRNVTNRAGLGSDDMQCTMHALSAGTPRLAAHEDFCQIGVFVQNNGLVVTGEAGF